ncbi:MAG: YlbF family regulator [Oscillospiraceae bacterium]|nr:YlbF family regulator [Oscillospiraceae bacterium]
MSEIIKKTRELGALIQQTEEFAAVQAAMQGNMDDEELSGIMRTLQMAESGYANEASSENANESKMKAYKEEFERLYEIAMARPAMQKYQEAHKTLGELMNSIFGILTLCADGDDPETCEVSAEDEDGCGGCGGGCACGCNA